VFQGSPELELALHGPAGGWGGRVGHRKRLHSDYFRDEPVPALPGGQTVCAGSRAGQQR
jgi:hypothetical protein